jgi:hypothetical protein
MVITYGGIQYLVCDSKKDERRLKYKSNRLESQKNDTGFILIEAEELENITGVDQENLELFYGKYWQAHKQAGAFPYIEINKRILFYSHMWREYAKKVKLPYKIENIEGIYYFPDELETELYALNTIELFLVLDSQHIIPFYYRGNVWQNERNIMHATLELPNDDLGKELSIYRRTLRVRVIEDKRGPLKVEVLL